ncbi:MAG: RloB domain-containing protein [Treponema sp.]
MERERTSKPRKMLPQFLVLCEGETEEAYVNLLRQNYRLPIKIVPKIIGSKISQKIINRYKKELSSKPESINTFLMYDGDIDTVVDNLKKCEGVLLLSRPCIEIWFVAHFKKIPEKEISSNDCVKMLTSIPDWNNYKKACFTIKQGTALWENKNVAVECMKKKSSESKTYSSIFQFIETLDKEKVRR